MHGDFIHAKLIVDSFDNSIFVLYYLLVSPAWFDILVKNTLWAWWS